MGIEIRIVIMTGWGQRIWGSGKGHKEALCVRAVSAHVWYFSECDCQQIIQLNVYGLWIFLYINLLSTTYLLNTFLKVMVNFFFFFALFHSWDYLYSSRLLSFAVMLTSNHLPGIHNDGPMIAFNGSLNPRNWHNLAFLHVFFFPLKVHSYHRILKRVHDPKMYLNRTSVLIVHVRCVGMVSVS